MKIKFDGVKKYQVKLGFFSIKMERTQDVEMKSRSLSTMKNDQPRFDHINQTFHFDNLLLKFHSLPTNIKQQYWFCLLKYKSW